MAKHASHARVLIPIVGALLVVTASLALATAGFAQGPTSGPNQGVTDTYCLECHANPSLTLTLPDGEVLSLYIPPESYQASLHTALGIECNSCHVGIETYPHPELTYTSRRELSRALYQACQRCHAENYDKALDSMHAQAAAAGNLDAPICTDCHSAHDIQPPDKPRARVSNTCGQCHKAIFRDYQESVHGSALVQEDNPDVPVCTDCHGVHNIHDPRTAQFRVESPELCAGCHANAELMSRYGLSADVYNLYSLSWHGVDIQVYRANWPGIWHESAVCTDCHGVHDIRRTSDPASRVNPANLLTTCQQCHPGAGPNWTGAWTGHNRVSLERTPFVFYTQLFYDSFAPFVLWLSGIYVTLQIVRATVARIRRSLR